MSDDFETIGSGDKPKETPIALPPVDDRPKYRTKRMRRFIFWMKFCGFFFILFLVVAIIGGTGAFFYAKPRYELAQSFNLEELKKVEIASRIFDRNGQELGRIFVQNRRPVALDQVSIDFINALLAAEDSRFYEHKGVDMIGVTRALYSALRTKEMNQGASTITQQLARQTFELKDRTISRKVTEMFLANRIEKEFSKQEILEFYLNRIYFGSGYYGIASAAEGYFDKDPSRLTPVEGATLAATVPNPYHRSPRSFPDTSKRWRNHVLTRMEAEGFIDKDTRDRGINSAVFTVPKGNITGKSAYVYEKVRQEVISLLGYEAVSKGGFHIHTTIDADIQTIAESNLKEQLDKIEQHPDFTHSTRAEYKQKKAAFKESATPDQKFPAPTYLQGALLLLDNRTGAVIASVGGRDFNDSMFDRTTQGRRPTGTAFKPFVYATAFEAGYFPGTLVDDTPMDARKVMIGGTTGILGEWGPETLDNTYENRITARRALAKSKNSASVRLGQKVGTSKVVTLATNAGMKFEGDLQKFNATFLGRNPSSLDELCLAYTIFPNHGRRPEKSFIISDIKDSAGNLIYTPQISMRAAPVIDRYTAFQISSILNDSFAYGTARKARDKFGLKDFPVAGKTGTEYDFTDNWFVGYTSEVTCVVWAGFDSTETIYPRAFSSDTVLPVWSKVMNAAADAFEPRPFLPPADAEQEEICLVSGELASDRCYELVTKPNGVTSQKRTTYIEFLRPGTRIETVCVIHGGKRRNLTQPQRTNDGLIRPQIVIAASAEPVMPIAPTIIGTDDPYDSISPVIRARIAVVEPEEEESEETEGAGGIRATPVDNNGLPVSRPRIIATPQQELPENRVALPPPRAIEFD